MGEIEVGLQCVADRFMAGELVAVIRGQGVNPVFDRGQVSNQCRAHPRCLPVGQDINVHKARGALDHGQHHRGIVFPIHRVQLPIADAGSLLDPRRALLDGVSSPAAPGYRSVSTTFSGSVSAYAENRRGTCRGEGTGRSMHG